MVIDRSALNSLFVSRHYDLLAAMGNGLFIVQHHVTLLGRDAHIRIAKCETNFFQRLVLRLREQEVADDGVADASADEDEEVLVSEVLEAVGRDLGDDHVVCLDVSLGSRNFHSLGKTY